MKNKKIDFNIKWEIFKEVKPFVPGKKCANYVNRKTFKKKRHNEIKGFISPRGRTLYQQSV